MKITQLFIDGTLDGLTYAFEKVWNAETYVEYMQIMNSGRVLGGKGFGSRYVIISVKYL